MHPDTELARFDGHTSTVWGVITIAWPDLDHPAIITTSTDGTRPHLGPAAPRHRTRPLAPSVKGWPWR